MPKPAASTHSRSRSLKHPFESRASVSRFGFASVIAAAGMSIPAAADIEFAQWNNASDFDYSVQYLPDFDQRRNGLASGGSAHCVPTSCMNMLAYAANFGFDNMAPYPGEWQGYAFHEEITGWIETLGDEMGTGSNGPGSGTGIQGARDGMREWVDDRPIMIDAYWRTDDWCPTLSNVVRAAAPGHLATIAYGRYDFSPHPQGGIRIEDRNGGHMVTMKYASKHGLDEALWTRDPADDNPIQTNHQSAYEYRIYDSVLTTQNLFHDRDGDGDWESFTGTLLEFSQNGSTARMIDKYLVLRPLSYYIFDESSFRAEYVGGGGWLSGGATPSIESTADLNILASAAEPGFQDVLVLAGDSGPEATLHRIRRNIGGETVREDLPFPHPATDIATGAPGHFYTINEGSDVILHHRLNASGMPEFVEQFNLPGPVENVVVSDRDRVVYAINGATRDLYRLQLTGWNDPTAMEQFYLAQTFFAPIRDLAACPKTGAIWALYDGIGRANRISINPNGTVNISIINDARIAGGVSVACDDRERVHISAGGELHSFRWTQQLEYEHYEDEWFAGVSPDGAFHVDYSRTNYDPAQHDTPGWSTGTHPDVLAAENLGHSVMDCPGDFDASNDVTISDLIDLLAQWGTGSELHDIAPPQGNGIIDVNDLIMLLANWGDCD